ncbi:MAG: hypothetical protein ACR2OZ_12040 [Verrucomicrobiales bacterium]
MRTMTVRDIRQHWPEAEKALAEEGEIIVTRDSIPVAKIVPYIAPPRSTKRQVKDFDAAEHLRWLQKVSRDEPPDRPSSDEILRDIRNKGHYFPPANESLPRRKHRRKTAPR